MAESSPVELGKLKPIKQAISPSQAKVLGTGINIVSNVVGPGKAKGLAIGLTKAARLAKEAKEVAEKAAGFSKPRVPVVSREIDYSPTPAKKIEATLEEKKLRRGVEEPRETSNKNLAVEKAKAFGLGSVSPEQRAAIEAQMNRGLRPDMVPLRTNPLPPEAVSIRPPLAPGVRKWTPETKKVTQPMKPVIPKPQVFDIKSSGVAPKIPRPKDELPLVPKAPALGAKNTEVRDSAGRLIFKKTPEQMQNLNEKLKNAKEAEEAGLKNFSDSTVRNSGTSVERTPGVFKERNWYENEDDAIKAFIARTKRESQGD
jgi:hypothetical protein